MTNQQRNATGELYRELGPHDRIELSGLAIGDRVSIEILPARRRNGRSRGRRITASIQAPHSVKILTARQRGPTME